MDNRLKLIHNKASHSSGIACEGCPTPCCPTGNKEGTYMLLLPKEREYMKEVGCSFEGSVETFTASNGVVLEFVENCPWLKDGWMCTIYQHRPLDCRTFPRIVTLDKAQLRFGEVPERCPSVGDLRQEHYEGVRAAWKLWFETTNPPIEWFEAVEELDKQKNI